MTSLWRAAAPKYCTLGIEAFPSPPPPPRRPPSLRHTPPVVFLQGRHMDGHALGRRPPRLRLHVLRRASIHHSECPGTCRFRNAELFRYASATNALCGPATLRAAISRLVRSDANTFHLVCVAQEKKLKA